MEDYFFFLREAWIVSAQNMLTVGESVELSILGKVFHIRPRGSGRGTVRIDQAPPQDFGTPDRLIVFILRSFKNESQEDIADAVSEAIDSYYY